jgi:DNA-binding GntR family transcriptional regulator
VGLAIWIEAGMKRGTTVTLARKRLRELHVGRGAARRALRALESAGLVVVNRSTGRAPRVTLLAPSE